MDDVGQCSGPKGSSVLFVRPPGAELHPHNRTNHFGIVTERQSSPFFGDLLRAQVGVPRKPAEAVEVCHREMVSQPVLITTYIGNGHKSSQWTIESLARNQFLHRRSTLGAHIEIQNLLPHRDQNAKMALLARVLLRNLKLYNLTSLFQRTKQRRGRLAHLEVDWAMLYLKKRVVIKTAVERLKVVICSACPVVLQVAPVHVMVVDESSIKDDAAVRLEGPRDHLGRTRRRPSVKRWAEPSLRIRFEHYPAKVGNSLVDFINCFHPPCGNL